MPFTFSHPAAVVPLTFLDKKRLSVTALTIGSITPDFEYFANFRQQALYSHTWLGVLWFDLPLSIILFAIYTALVKDELIDNLPTFLRKRFQRFKNTRKSKFSVYRSLVVLTSLLIGIASHLFWDKLLHRSVQLVEEPMNFYPIYWDGHSILGAIVIAFIIVRLPKTTVPKHDMFLFWFVTLLVTWIVLVIRSMRSVHLRDLQVSLISGFLIALVIASAISKLRRTNSDSNKSLNPTVTAESSTMTA